MKTYTRTWRLEINKNAHEIGEVCYDWSYYYKTRILSIKPCGTHEVIVRITRDTEKECKEELNGQISDGFFENMKVSIKEEIV